MKYSTCNGLDAISLVLWLVVAPNVKTLDLQSMKKSDKMKLINELNLLLIENDRINLILDRIEVIYIWKFQRAIYTRAMRNLYQIISNIFSRAKICD